MIFDTQIVLFAFGSYAFTYTLTWRGKKYPLRALPAGESSEVDIRQALEFLDKQTFKKGIELAGDRAHMLLPPAWLEHDEFV